MLETLRQSNGPVSDFPRIGLGVGSRGGPGVGDEDELDLSHDKIGLGVGSGAGPWSLDLGKVCCWGGVNLATEHFPVSEFGPRWVVPLPRLGPGAVTRGRTLKPGQD